jgi:glycosyltransferase involved in cell wall biosynthesis
MSLPYTVYYISPGGMDARGGMGGMARYLTQAYKRLEPAVTCKVLDPYGSRLSWQTPLKFLIVCTRIMLGGLLRRVQVIHIHMSHGGSVIRKLLLLRIAGLAGVPVIVHLHGSRFQTYCEGLKPERRQAIGRRLSDAARVVVIGEFWKNYLVQALGVPAQSVTVIYNGVPMTERPAPRITREKVRIVTAGLIGQRKGTGDLLQALAAPNMANLHWHAALAGNGEVERFQRLAADLGISDRVEFPGWVGPVEIATLLRDADIFVLPSYNEGLPVAILEAMMAALPVVTTPVGAIAELVLQDETGILLPPGNPPELTAALVALIRSPERRRMMGENGRDRVEKYFSIDIVAQQLLALYANVRRG